MAVIVSIVMKMFKTDASDLLPSSASNDQLPASNLLRPYRRMLIERLTESEVAGLTDNLYEMRVISEEELEEIQTQTSISRRNRNRILLSVIHTRSWSQGITFARLLLQTGLKDVGTQLLKTAGESYTQAVSCSRQPQISVIANAYKLYRGHIGCPRNWLGQLPASLLMNDACYQSISAQLTHGPGARMQ